MILLDFFSGSHGHFLEYLINSYIFRGPRVDNVLTSLGTSHGIRKDKFYMDCRFVVCGHYTEFNVQIPKNPDQIVQISIDSDMEKVIYQLNVIHRAGDIPLDKKIQSIPELIKNNPTRLRNNYFSKLNGDGYLTPKNWRWEHVPSYQFPMKSLYNLNDLHAELYQLSKFLNHSFNPDQSLSKLWKDFIQANQGLQCWKLAQKILEYSWSNENYEFFADTWTQAVLNHLISQTLGLYDGPLFEQDKYPNNSQQIYQILQQHICRFDSKFNNLSIS